MTRARARGDEALLEAWERARRTALRRCRRTFARLHAGCGGFYGADDFEQDLFLEFWSLWHRHGGVADERLWAAWDATLWGGGLRILRRRPQRLWRRHEVPVAPTAFEGADPEPGPQAGLPAAARNRALVEREASAEVEEAEAVARLEAALRRLSPGQREVLYLLALRGLPAAEIARRLEIPSSDAVYQRARRARRSLARGLAGQDGRLRGRRESGEATGADGTD